MQETDFPFEILIHDDASTDETAKIIKEYEEKYPDIIKPIYQSENQYSQDVSISATYNFPRAKGKYIALCEGDDFWTESNKLQTQVNYLEEHPSFSACYHPINWIESDKDKNTIYAPTIEKEYYDENNVFENILQITLCSTVLRTKTLENHLDDFKTIPYADNLIHILNARNGFIGYLPKVMATYRRHSGGVYSGPLSTFV
jgi:glycosyltransferase involved in cell wall biosynthesis